MAREGGRVGMLPAWCYQLCQAGWQPHGDCWGCRVTWRPGAAEWVLAERNNRNRRPVEHQIRTLAKCMRDDAFLFTGETIIFDREGELINGQNRLHACVRSGCTFESMVIVGVDPDAFAVLDQHSKRSLTAVLGIMGEVNCDPLGTLLYGIPRFYDTGAVLVGVNTKGHTRTMEGLLEGLKSFPGVRDSAAFAGGWDRSGVKMFKGKGAVALLHWVFAQVNRRMASEFFTRIQKGTMGDEGDLWHPLRTLANKTLAQNLDSRTRLNPGLTEAFTVLAWNDLRSSRKPHNKYRWDLSAGFPRVDGWSYVDGLPLRAIPDEEAA